MVNFLNFTKHAVAGSSRLLATSGGRHILNIKADADTDNGSIIGKGDFKTMEYYAAADPTTFTGTIVGVASNGNFYVEVATAENAFLVLTTPMIYEEYAQKFQEESNFYNANGSIMRCYELGKYDVFELSAEGFSGTPQVGKTVTVETRKVKVNED